MRNTGGVGVRYPAGNIPPKGVSSQPPPQALIENLKRRYPALIATLREKNAEFVKQHPLPWLLKMIEDVYDARYLQDAGELDVWCTATGQSFQQSGRGSAQLLEQWDSANNPVGMDLAEFMNLFCKKRLGLRPLVERTLWELLCNADAARQAGLHISVDLFCAFLHGTHNTEELLFFLYCRQVVMEEASRSVPSTQLQVPIMRHGTANASLMPPTHIKLTHKQALNATRLIFGRESSVLYQAICQLLDDFFAGDATIAVDSLSEDGCMEAYPFLRLLLSAYHDTSPPYATFPHMPPPPSPPPQEEGPPALDPEDALLPAARDPHRPPELQLPAEDEPDQEEPEPEQEPAPSGGEADATGGADGPELAAAHKEAAGEGSALAAAPPPEPEPEPEPEATPAPAPARAEYDPKTGAGAVQPWEKKSLPPAEGSPFQALEGNLARGAGERGQQGALGGGRAAASESAEERQRRERAEQAELDAYTARLRVENPQLDDTDSDSGPELLRVADVLRTGGAFSSGNLGAQGLGHAARPQPKTAVSLAQAWAHTQGCAPSGAFAAATAAAPSPLAAEPAAEAADSASPAKAGGGGAAVVLDSPYLSLKRQRKRAGPRGVSAAELASPGPPTDAASHPDAAVASGASPVTAAPALAVTPAEPPTAGAGSDSPGGAEDAAAPRGEQPATSSAGPPAGAGSTDNGSGGGRGAGGGGSERKRTGRHHVYTREDMVEVVTGKLKQCCNDYIQVMMRVGAGSYDLPAPILERIRNEALTQLFQRANHLFQDALGLAELQAAGEEAAALAATGPASGEKKLQGKLVDFLARLESGKGVGMSRMEAFVRILLGCPWISHEIEPLLAYHLASAREEAGALSGPSRDLTDAVLEPTSGGHPAPQPSADEQRPITLESQVPPTHRSHSSPRYRLTGKQPPPKP